jgi:hypothetical protein
MQQYPLSVCYKKISAEGAPDGAICLESTAESAVYLPDKHYCRKPAYQQHNDI